MQQKLEVVENLILMKSRFQGKKGDYKMSTATCIKDYDGVGFLKENKDGREEVHIKKGDVIEWDNQGYLWFDNVRFGHMDAYPGQYFKF